MLPMRGLSGDKSINPPKNAFMVSLDEKTGMQAVSPSHEKLPVALGMLRREIGVTNVMLCSRFILF